MLRVNQLTGFGAGGLITIGRVLANSGSYVLVGNTAGIQKASNRILAAGASSYSLTGTAATLTSTNPASAFLARTSGLDTTHTNAYTALINGLVADGVWTKLDVLYIFATQTSANALLNLVSASYPATAIGSPTFVADRGYTGALNSTSIIIDSGFNPTTASSPKFTLNSAHISVWNVTHSFSAVPSIGAQDASNRSAYIYAKINAGASYFRVNGANSGSGSYSAPDTSGHFFASRTASGAQAGYLNGASVETDGTTASGIPNANVHCLGFINSSSVTVGVPNQQAMMSIGSGFTSTDVTNFYNRHRTYMTAMGVP